MSDAQGTKNQDMINRRNAIADSADEKRADDLVDLGEPDRSYTASEESQELPKKREEWVDEEEETEQVEASQQSPTKHKLKINGKEEELTTEELIARAQKVAAADDYLEQAKNAFKGSLETRLQTQPSQDVETQQEVDYKALARALQMGTEDEAAEVIKKLSQPSAPKVDVGRIVDEKLSLREAASKFTKEYKDVLENPQLKEFFDLKEAQLIASGDKRSNLERWKSIGDDLRAFAPQTSNADKLARKASVAQVPKASGRQVPNVTEEEEDDPATVISKMARNRGQNRATRQ